MRDLYSAVRRAVQRGAHRGLLRRRGGAHGRRGGPHGAGGGERGRGLTQAVPRLLFQSTDLIFSFFLPYPVISRHSCFRAGRWAVTCRGAFVQSCGRREEFSFFLPFPLISYHLSHFLLVAGMRREFRGCWWDISAFLYKNKVRQVPRELARGECQQNGAAASRLRSFCEDCRCNGSEGRG